LSWGYRGLNGNSLNGGGRKRGVAESNTQLMHIADASPVV
jgi:hypothetical protein